MACWLAGAAAARRDQPHQGDRSPGGAGRRCCRLTTTSWKLLRKGAVYSRTTTWVFGAGPVGRRCAARWSRRCSCPAAGCPRRARLPGRSDPASPICSALARFFTVLAALDTGSSFEGMGASREVSLLGAGRAGAAARRWRRWRARRGALALRDLSARPARRSGRAPAPALLLVVAALFVVLLAENARIPVDDPNTHLELTMIHEVMVLDHGGPDLALIRCGARSSSGSSGALIVADRCCPRATRPPGPRSGAAAWRGIARPGGRRGRRRIDHGAAAPAARAAAAGRGGRVGAAGALLLVRDEVTHDDVAGRISSWSCCSCTNLILLGIEPAARLHPHRGGAGRAPGPAADPGGRGHRLAIRVIGLAAASIAIKGLVFPWLLFRALRGTDVRREVEPFVGYSASIVAGWPCSASRSGSARACRCRARAASPLALPAALFTMLTGLFLIVTRRKALTQVLGYLVLENGIFAFGIAVEIRAGAAGGAGRPARRLRGGVRHGHCIFHIHREFDHIDTDQLSTLKDWNP